MRALCDLSKITITWPFGHFRRRFLLQHLFQSLHFKRILIKGYCYLRQSAFGPFERGLLFGWFFKNFPWPSLCTFSENAGFGWPCENCHNLAIRALLEPLSFRLNCLQSFHQSAFGPFKRGLLFGRFLKTFSLSPVRNFSENACFGLPCKNHHNMANRALLEQLFTPKSSPLFAL